MFSIFKTFSLAGKIISVVAPLIVIGGAIFLVNNFINGKVQQGFDSRNVEVATLLSEISLLQTEKLNLTNNLITCNARKNSLISEVGALKDDKTKALKAQAELHSAAQKITTSALKSLAQSKRAPNIDIAALIKEMKDVTYKCDDTGNGIVVGGADLLRNKAAGN